MESLRLRWHVISHNIFFIFSLVSLDSEHGRIFSGIYARSSNFSFLISPVTFWNSPCRLVFGNVRLPPGEAIILSWSDAIAGRLEEIPKDTCWPFAHLFLSLSHTLFLDFCFIQTPSSGVQRAHIMERGLHYRAEVKRSGYSLVRLLFLFCLWTGHQLEKQLEMMDCRTKCPQAFRVHAEDK